MKLSLGFSPCPNDTFIFDALVNGKIDKEGLEFDLHIEDVQTLNEKVQAGELDISKISYGTLPLVAANYIALRAGGALGRGTGPLLIALQQIDETSIARAKIAIPGQHTTAHVLFSLAYPEATNKVFLNYDRIEDFLLDNDSQDELRLGVIIHENRFTYEEKGLIRIKDLGNYWEETTGTPIPLGAIVVRRGMGKELSLKLTKLIRQSLAYSWSRWPAISDFVREHAQEMDEAVMRKHINLYVNDFSADIGGEGEKAVENFLKLHSAIHKIELSDKDYFISE